MIIKANVLYDGRTRREACYVHIEGNHIKAVTERAERYDFEGIVTPAFVDPHSHIGMFREGEPSSEAEGNDMTDQIQPLNEPLQSIYMDDPALTYAIDFGVLYSCIVPGSGNVIGGKTTVIRHFASNVDGALVKYLGYKMALGYNPTSTRQWKGTRPNTRMGVNALLEERFDTLLAREKKVRTARDIALLELDESADGELLALKHEQIEADYHAAFTATEHALLDLLQGNKLVKIHVHKEDDALYLIELVKKYGLRASAEHCMDIHHRHIFEALDAAGIPVVFGPLGSVGYKTELKHASYKNVSELVGAKVPMAVMSDHPVIHAHTLRDASQYFMIAGLDATDAINLLTRENARAIDMDAELGTIEPGKWASLLLWDREPMMLGAIPRVVIGEGRVLRQ
ncbi:amidohydrolase family protein [Sulfurimonas sp. HSL1-2]|uniref:amidohydrolase family protein n=1 Tax=Thiomicrolovo zhangzhouensis TaxID=3131933 RepID=UPI0031F8B712